MTFSIEMRMFPNRLPRVQGRVGIVIVSEAHLNRDLHHTDFSGVQIGHDVQSIFCLSQAADLGQLVRKAQDGGRGVFVLTGGRFHLLSSPEQVGKVGRIADGVVVGSALVQLIELRSQDSDLPAVVEAETRRLSAPLHDSSSK